MKDLDFITIICVALEYEKRGNIFILPLSDFKWSMRDSNSPPLDCQSNALAR